MSYYFNKQLQNVTFDEAIEKVTAALKEKGFGVLTTIDVDEVFKEKLDADFRRYKILGACNPNFAFKALSEEDKAGTMLPCNVILQDTGNGIEVAAIDPVKSMQAIDNRELEGIAREVRQNLKDVIDELK